LIFGLKLYMSDDIWQLCLNLLRNDGWEHFFLNSGEGGILCSCTLCDLKIRDGIHLKNSIKLLVTYFFMVEFSQRLGNSIHFFFSQGTILMFLCCFAGCWNRNKYWLFLWISLKGMWSYSDSIKKLFNYQSHQIFFPLLMTCVLYIMNEGGKNTQLN
jgi:hypothetical protein